MIWVADHTKTKIPIGTTTIRNTALRDYNLIKEQIHSETCTKDRCAFWAVRDGSKDSNRHTHIS